MTFLENKRKLLGFQLFMLEFLWRPFHWCINYHCRTDGARMISELQNKSKYKSKFNFNLYQKNQIFGFPCCSSHEALSIDASITTVGLICKYWRSYNDFISRGTDRQTWFWNPQMETCWHTNNFNSKLKIAVCIPG